MTDSTTRSSDLTFENPLHPDALRVLRALFELGRRDIPAHVGLLTGCLGIPAPEVAAHLLALEVAGLARADLARLSLAGLLLATRLPAEQRDGSSVPREPGTATMGRRLTPNQSGRRDATRHVPGCVQEE